MISKIKSSDEKQDRLKDLYAQRVKIKNRSPSSVEGSLIESWEIIDKIIEYLVSNSTNQKKIRSEFYGQTKNDRIS
jgi:hypothetical protein